MRVALGSDHSGFQLKECLKPCFGSLGIELSDLGTATEAPCDYPDFARAVARAVASGEATWGVVLDGAGVGSSIAANKVPGIRAALCNDPVSARNARSHNDANVLVLGARIVGIAVAEEIVRVFASTPFEGGRHQRRIDKISALETRSVAVHGGAEADDQLLATIVRLVIESLAESGAISLCAPPQTPAGQVPAGGPPAPAAAALPTAAEPLPKTPALVAVPPATVPAAAPLTATMPNRRFWTEADVAAQIDIAAGTIHIPAGVRITPLARDYLRERRVTLV